MIFRIGEKEDCGKKCAPEVFDAKNYCKNGDFVL